MEGGEREGRHAAEQLVCGGRTSCASGTLSCTQEVSYSAISYQGLSVLTKALVHCPSQEMLGLVNNWIMDEGCFKPSPERLKHMNTHTREVKRVDQFQVEEVEASLPRTST
eukprot:3588615-Rhodomonas_salina.1